MSRLLYANTFLKEEGGEHQNFPGSPCLSLECPVRPGSRMPWSLMVIANIALGERALGRGQERELWSHLIWVKILALGLVSKSFNFSEPQFARL